MSRRALWALAGLALGGCGLPGEDTPIRFDLVMSRALVDKVSGFQVSIVARGAQLDCAQVQGDCLVKQVTSDRYVTQTDSAGKEKKAVFFALELKAGTPSTQDVKLTGITPGKDYAVVIEALSNDATPTLVGSSCNYVREVVVGQNPQLIAATIVPPATPVACDPRI